MTKKGRKSQQQIEMDRHLEALAEQQPTDFRAANIFKLVGDRVPPGARALDVGCGAGGLVASLLDRGIDAEGIDTSEEAIAAARRFLEGRGHDPARVQVEPVSARLARGPLADVAISMDCLEHVEDDASLFAEIVRAVRPGGRLIITVPAMQSLYGERDRRIGHYRRYSREELLQLAEREQIRVDEVRYWNLLGVAPTFISQRILGRNVDESFRFGEPNLQKRVLRGALGLWFRHIENAIRPPLGLTLLLVGSRAR